MSDNNLVSLSSGLRLLSMCYGKLGDVQTATQLSEESVAIAHHSLPNNHPQTVLCESWVQWLLSV